MNHHRFITRLAGLALMLLAPLAWSLDPVAIIGVEVSQVSAEKHVIRISFNGQAPMPASFSVSTPPRIALDFADTTNQSGKSSLQVNGNVLRMVNIAEGTGRTRMVLNLHKQASHQVLAEGQAVLITVEGMESTSSTGKSAHFSDAVSDGNQGIRAIDFRRGGNGEGKVIVDLSSPDVGIDIRQQGKQLVVEFARAALPKKLERRLDVTDFGTPVQTIDAFALASQTRMVIEPRGNWEYSAYQTESRFTIEVREAADEAGKPARDRAYQGEKLSLNFQNVEIRTLLQVLAEFTGMNIVTSDSVTGSLTLRLKDVPWDQAMDLILQAKGLDQRKTGNVIWIAPREELGAKERQEFENRKQVEELIPTRQELFRLKYQKAEDFEKILKSDKNSLLSKRGSVVKESMTNTLIVNDIPARLEEIRELIAKTDIPPRQVMIEARIVEANDTFSRELGSRLSFFYSDSPLAARPSSTTGDTTLRGGAGGGFNLPGGAITGFPAGSISMLAAGANGILSLELSALESEGRGKIISSPRLITADRIEAAIEDGQEIPFTETAPNGATTVSFKKATLSLKVTPQITPDGNVIMDLQVNKDSRGQDTSAGPAIDTKQIKTKVLVENGGTVVIGGIYTQTLQDTTDQIPLLGDIPLLGALFRHKGKVDEKREMLIFISPRILAGDLTLR